MTALADGRGRVAGARRIIAPLFNPKPVARLFDDMPEAAGLTTEGEVKLRQSG